MPSPASPDQILAIPPREVIRCLESETGRALPAQGFLAGASVLAAAYRILGARKPPLRDIDVFRQSTWEDRDEYAGHSAVITIQKAARDGPLNFIDAALTNEPWSLINLLNRFDVDCTQIGLDLAAPDALVATNAFCEFADTNTLTVRSIFTPACTLQRLFQKSEDLGAPFSTMRECMLLGAMIHPQNPLNRNMVISLLPRDGRRDEEALQRRVQSIPIYGPLKREMPEHWLERLRVHFDASVRPAVDGKTGRLGLVPNDSLPLPNVPYAMHRWENGVPEHDLFLTEFQQNHPRITQIEVKELDF